MVTSRDSVPHMPLASHFILYVRDQSVATAFYRAVLGADPTLDVAGMTEFQLADGAVLGLMPESAIARLMGARLPDPTRRSGTPRAELYLVVEDPHAYHARAVAAGADELSPVTRRSWGARVGYLLDLDGHVLAFATHNSD